MSNSERTVTFVLTGPRKGHTGVLGGRYGFKDGKLKAPEHLRAPLATILCNRYACNIEGESPLWRTDKDGAAVKVTELDLKMDEPVSTVVEDPKAVLKGKAPPPGTTPPPPKQ